MRIVTLEPPGVILSLCCFTMHTTFTSPLKPATYQHSLQHVQTVDTHLLEAGLLVGGHVHEHEFVPVLVGELHDGFHHVRGLQLQIVTPGYTVSMRLNV